MIGEDINFELITVSELGNPIRPKSLVIPATDQQITEQYLHQLCDKQAAAIVLQSTPALPLPEKLSAIVTPNLAVGLANLSAVWRTQFSIPMICVAGSSGKTTTAALLSHLLTKR